MPLLLSPKKIAGANIASDLMREGIYEDKDELNKRLNSIKKKNEGLYNSIVETLKEYDVFI